MVFILLFTDIRHVYMYISGGDTRAHHRRTFNQSKFVVIIPLFRLSSGEKVNKTIFNEDRSINPMHE